jgi:hypothetical protein
MRETRRWYVRTVSDLEATIQQLTRDGWTILRMMPVTGGDQVAVLARAGDIHE